MVDTIEHVVMQIGQTSPLVGRLFQRTCRENGHGENAECRGIVVHIFMIRFVYGDRLVAYIRDRVARSSCTRKSECLPSES